MIESISYTKQIPVRYDVDVFVAGGGPAGIAAAVAAARQGRSVYLAESLGCLGGMGTAGMVPAFMMFGDGVHFLAGGIGREVDENLTCEKGPDYPCSRNNIPAEMLKRVYDRMVVKAGVQFTFHTTVVDLQMKGNRVALAICNAKSGFFAVRAKMFVDCTGDGDLAAWAGAPFEKGDEEGNMMPGTLCSLWSDVDYDRFVAMGGTEELRNRLRKAFADGVFTVNDPHHPGVWRVAEHSVGGNFGHAFGVDSTDERSLTHFLLEGRERMCEFQHFYRTYVDGFEKAELAATGSILGIRESRRILGDYVLNGEDFLARAIFEDEIGRYCYPVDIHPSRPDPKIYAAFLKEFSQSMRYGKGESYGIPYRTLTPRGLENLLVAGRCISCDRKLQGSVRVMPACFITGQAAGMACAIACEKDTSVRGFEVKELQSRLAGMGACLPNFMRNEKGQP